MFLCFLQTYIVSEDPSLPAAGEQMADDPGQKTGKSLLHSMAPHRGALPGCLCISDIVVSLVARLIPGFLGHPHAHYCFKMSVDSTFKITSLFSILTGTLGQADMVVMNHRGGKESYRAMQIWLKNEQMVPK